MSAKRGLPPRKQLDEDGMPLESAEPAPEVKQAKAVVRKSKRTEAPRSESKPTVAKERFTVTLPPDLIEDLRDASFETRETMARLVERGIGLVLAQVVADLGGEVPKRPAGGELRKGRPLKGR